MWCAASACRPRERQRSHRLPRAHQCLEAGFSWRPPRAMPPKSTPPNLIAVGPPWLSLAGHTERKCLRGGNRLPPVYAAVTVCPMFARDVRLSIIADVSVPPLNVRFHKTDIKIDQAG